jgi:pilus assembly protein Flp/PilA
MQGKPAMEWLRRLIRDEQGATAIEYAIIAGSIAVAIAATVTAIGTSVRVPYSTVSSALR